jgi:GDP/UDP-N,N'-diacetylbacillosamine 2-epimerase (hydrolysing)
MELGLIVFGTHLSPNHGYTIDAIVKDEFPVFKTIESLPLGDAPKDIADSYAKTAKMFNAFWSDEGASFDLVFALGDRYEMAAAVAASIPFGIKIAHLHGGETTLGAIDNIYRHSISLASWMHFVSTEAFGLRLRKLLDTPNPLIFNVGSLSLENLEQMQLLDIDAFYELWNIDLNEPTILVTIHPETVDFSRNDEYSIVIAETLSDLAREFQIVITMPNADISGMIYRHRFLTLSEAHATIHIVENFGTQSYFTCMKYAQILLGNTSSGIIEAASFQKYVINVGNRQKGRLCAENVIHVPFLKNELLNKVHQYMGKVWMEGNIYYQPRPAEKILMQIRNYFGSL